MSIWTDLLMFHGYVVNRNTLALLTSARGAASAATASAPDPADDGEACAVRHPPHALRTVCQLR